MTEVSQTPPQIQRLIDWNADVLLKLLKRIVAKRQAQGKEGWTQDPEIDYGETVLDEVADVIEMPGFEHHSGPKSVEVPPQVAEQLREFVTKVCLAHRNHPMHSLQHSSHVTMAISKLIARISVEHELDANHNDMSDDVADSLATHLHNHTFGITSDPLIQFSAVLSALVHAVDHRGISNEDLVLEEPEEAKKYKNKSMTEQRSVEKAWAKLMSPNFESLRRCIYADKEEKKRFRQIFVNSIMATDIMDEEMQVARMKRWEDNFGPRATHDVDINRKATIVLECLMQSSDVFHTMQNWHVFLKWTEREFEEENKAFKEGRSKQNPVESMYKDMLRFLDNYIIPLAMQLKDIDAFVVNSDEYLNFALKNRQGWASSGQEIVSALNDKYNGPKEEFVSATIKMARVMVDEDGEPLPGQEAPESLPRHQQRLVDWNCEILGELLKKVVAKREAAGKPSGGAAPDFKGDIGKPVVDEVVEVLQFEKYDETTTFDKLHPEKVELSAAVVAQLRDYVTQVSKEYRDHPYHCIDKGSHMSMTTHRLLSRLIANQAEVAGGSSEELHKKTYGIVSDPLVQFAAVFASLVHDVQHPGVPNAQLVAEKDDLAIKYDNRSVAEQHSTNVAWSLLMNPRYEDLRAAIYSDDAELNRFRQILVNCSLSTDFVDDKLLNLRQERWNKAFVEGKDDYSQENMDRKATCALITLMQAADSFHALGHWYTYQKWSQRQFEEAYKAYDHGRMRQDPCLYWYKSELMYLDEFVIPLCQQMQMLGIFGSTADECLAFAMSNKMMWMERGGELVVAMLNKYHGRAAEKARSQKIAKRKSLGDDW